MTPTFSTAKSRSAVVSLPRTGHAASDCTHCTDTSATSAATSSAVRPEDFRGRYPWSADSSQCIVTGPLIAFTASVSASRPASESRVPLANRHGTRSEEHTSELQSRFDLVCRLLLEKKKTYEVHYISDLL